MRLTIVTINKNNLAGLERTLTSIFAQPGEWFESVVVDGASDDGSVAFLKQCTDPRLLWISEGDKGIYDAMNKGMGLSHGDYCLFLNSGDSLASQDVLERIGMDAFRDDLVYGDLLYSSSGKLLPARFPDVVSLEYLVQGFLPHPATFYRRGMLIELGGFTTQYRYVSDWVFSLEALFLKNVSYRHISVFVSIFDATGPSASRDLASSLDRERKLFLDAKFRNVCLGLAAKSLNQRHFEENPNSKIIQTAIRVERGVSCIKAWLKSLTDGGRRSP
jgi:glycosyltransferase involved in cell wall biosynthesis